MTLTGIIGENVAESTETAPGTGTFSLGGAVGAGRRTFVAAIGSGNPAIYVATDATGANWEVGYGTVTTGTPDTLTRTAVFSSSNSGNKVNFATAPTVFGATVGTILNSLLSLHKDSSRPAWLPAGGLWIDETNDPTWTLKLWDGTDDIPLLDLDTTNNRFALKAMLGDLEIEDTDAGASAGPEFVLYRNSASPADNDLLGIHKFRGRNDNSQDVLFAQIIAQALDVSDTEEDGQLLLQAIIAGAMTTIIAAGANGVTVGSPTGGAPGAGGLNAEALQVNGNDVITTQVEAADQAEMEAASATDVFVTPGRQHFHPSAAKGWGKFQVNGSLRSPSYNISSITDNSTGNWTVNWDTNFSSEHYAVLPTPQMTDNNDINISANSPAAGSVVILAGATTGIASETDLEEVHVVAFGDFA